MRLALAKSESTPSRALVLLSGGQDSVTLLGVALERYEEVYAISFSYKQKHVIELQCAKQICEAHGVHLKVVDLGFFGDMVTSELTKTFGDMSLTHLHNKNLPASYVPNRNALFLTLAHAYAQEIGVMEIYAGMCQTDYSGYPDCRAVFIESLQNTLNTGYETSIYFITPLMFLSKAEIFEVADEHDFLDTVITKSHTCYNGDRTTLHAWGYGCSKCPSCLLRKNGYGEFIREKVYT